MNNSHYNEATAEDEKESDQLHGVPAKTRVPALMLTVLSGPLDVMRCLVRKTNLHRGRPEQLARQDDTL